MRRIARLLVLVGVLGAVFGLSKLHAVAHGYVFHGSFRLGWAFAYAGLLWVAAYAVGIPDLARRRNVWVFAVAASSVGAIAISTLQLLVGSALLPRVVVFGAAIVLVPWYVLCSLVAAGGRLRAEARDRVIVVGAVHEDELLRAELEESAEQPAQVIASLLVADAAGRDDGSEPLVDRAIADEAGVVVLSRTAQDDDRIVEQAAVLHEAGVRVRSLADFYEQWLGKLPLGELERVSLMFDIREVHREQYARVKRLLDVAIACAGLTVLAVTVPFVFVANLLLNRGTLFYRQQRVGRDGRRFSILKYRTMVSSPDEATPNEWTTQDDPRITPFGRVLRRLHLDELPQVLNILRGDLSVVGPRPEQPQYVEELTDKIPFYALRHLVRPGLTGWAQVKFGYAGDERDALEKLQYDFFYLRHQSLALDARIIGRTLRELVDKGGR